MRWRWPSIISSTPARTSLVAAPASGRCSSKLVSLVGISSNMLRADTRSPALTQRNGTHRSVAGMRAEKRDLGHQRRCVRSSFLASGWGTGHGDAAALASAHAGGGRPAPPQSTPGEEDQLHSCPRAPVVEDQLAPAATELARDGAPRRRQSTPSTVLGRACCSTG